MLQHQPPVENPEYTQIWLYTSVVFLTVELFVGVLPLSVITRLFSLPGIPLLLALKFLVIIFLICLFCGIIGTIILYGCPSILLLLLVIGAVALPFFLISSISLFAYQDHSRAARYLGFGSFLAWGLSVVGTLSLRAPGLGSSSAWSVWNAWANLFAASLGAAALGYV